MIASGAPLFMALWGVPFVLVGLYIMAGRFWVDAGQRAATVYAVTSERVVIVSGVVSRRVKSLSVDTLSDVSLTERASASSPMPFSETFGPTPNGLSSRSKARDPRTHSTGPMPGGSCGPSIRDTGMR